jgi:hypothetical protein
MKIEGKDLETAQMVKRMEYENEKPIKIVLLKKNRRVLSVNPMTLLLKAIVLQHTE